VKMQVELRHEEPTRLGFVCLYIDIDSMSHLHRLVELNIADSTEMMRELRELSHTEQKTVVIVLHDINQAAQFADTVVTMKNGRVLATGAPVDVLTQETMKDLYNVDVTVLNHQGRPVIVDTV